MFGGSSKQKLKQKLHGEKKTESKKRKKMEKSIFRELQPILFFAVLTIHWMHWLISTDPQNLSSEWVQICIIPKQSTTKGTSSEHPHNS